MPHTPSKPSFFTRIKQSWKKLSEIFGGGTRGIHKSLTIKIIFAVLAVVMALIFNQAFRDYTDVTLKIEQAGGDASLEDIPSLYPLAGKGIGAFMTLVALFVSLWIREKGSDVVRHRLTVSALWIASLGCLFAYLPADVLATQGALEGKALAGENPSIPAYIGQLIAITFLILSPPIMAQLFFRLELMDQYVVKSFLSPFFFCMMAFTSIWLIADFSDNGPAFTGQASKMAEFYLVQIPYMILFVLPIAIMLSLLFALAKMSKSNELISMIGAGRSVCRILFPLIFIGIYSSLIALALKYEWSPTSAGTKEAILQEALNERHRIKTGEIRVAKGRWTGYPWMHVNDYASRTWFVGLVPNKLSDPMANVVIWQVDDNGQPILKWQAREATWNWKTQCWTLKTGKLYRYRDDRIPLIEPFESHVLEGWNETPWKVLSSSQNPEFLGMQGLTMYLEANQELEKKDLASFRTNLWNIFAEPAVCFAMVLVAAPLGIVYSRKGVLGGVTTAVVIFALMYMMKGTTMALGQGNRIPPFLGAWLCNFVVIGIGAFLLWLRSRNRDVPKPSRIFLKIITLGLAR